MKVRAWAKTDVGKQRTINEDCHFLDMDLGLLLVFDGMGGHRAGEIASNLAMETMASFYHKYVNSIENHLEIFDNFDDNFSFKANLLRQAVYAANRIVLQKSYENESMVGMGSTVAGLAIDGLNVAMVNVGDSRLYLVRKGYMEQISRDHTLAEDQVERGLMSREEARESHLRHILSSVIGVDSRIRVHMDELVAFPGDIFFLCTDGLTAVVSDEEILQDLTNGPLGPETLDRLIEKANERGGPDNMTLALAVFSDDPPEEVSEPRKAVGPGVHG